MKKLLILAVSTLVLTGCYHPASPTASPSRSPVGQSSCDVDKELEAIDNQLQDAEKEDIPQVDEKTLGL